MLTTNSRLTFEEACKIYSTRQSVEVFQGIQLIS